MPVPKHSSVPLHPGERKMQSLVYLPTQPNPASPYLTPGAGFMLTHSPLLAVGTLDPQGRPWTSVWGGEAGFARPVAESVVGLVADVDSQWDPVVKALVGEQKDEKTGKKDKGKLVGGLAIDLENRMRVKLAGRMVAGMLVNEEDEDEEVQQREKKPRKRKRINDPAVEQLQLLMHIDESLGNCPKYLNKKHIYPAAPDPDIIHTISPSHLPSEAIALLAKADLFFITSTHGTRSIDTNHRGGPPGFVRVLSNAPSSPSPSPSSSTSISYTSDETVLVYPEYSGNRLYQTLGNLTSTPHAGITVPDFATGDVLYMTGTTDILVGEAAAEVLPRSNLAIRVHIAEARFVRKGLAFRGEEGELSPYNPPVRYAVGEKGAAEEMIGQPGKGMTAKLLRKTFLTPNIARFRFRVGGITQPKKWTPGQHATLSFAEHLDQGWSHMRDDDPTSLNDDFVRTFTVSGPSPTDSSPPDEFEITVRRVGRATEFLFKQKPGFMLPLLGFAGDFHFPKHPDGSGRVVPVIAGGIGITPVLGQMSVLNISQLRLLWTVNVADIGLVVDVFQHNLALKDVTTVFVTGDENNMRSGGRKVLEELESNGARIERRRMEEKDVQEVNREDGVDEWYLCASAGLKKAAMNWLHDRRLMTEDFGY